MTFRRALVTALATFGLCALPQMAAAQYNQNSTYNQNSGYNQNYNNNQRITCSSDDGRRHYCQMDTRNGVQLTRQISSIGCVQGSNWGYDNNGVWVDNSCSAEFTSGGNNGQYNNNRQYGSNGGYYGRRHDRGRYGNGNVATQTIRCESTDNGNYNTYGNGYNNRQYCAADARGGVHIQRELSNNACREGQTWGYDNGGVWVSNGCRADFEVDSYPTSYYGTSTVIPAGTTVSIRADENIDSKNAYIGQRYAADVAEDVTDSSGRVIIPRGSQAELVLHDANGNYNNNGNTSASNSNNLVIDLDSVTVNGQRMMTSTEDVQKSGTGIGANKKTGEYVGGGALLGAIIGAVAGGGKGAAIGAAVGAGAGAGGVILTKGHTVSVPAETVLKFKLDQDLALRGVR